MEETKKNITELGDEALEDVSGGWKVKVCDGKDDRKVLGSIVGYCENCGATLTSRSKYLIKVMNGKTYYYCESHHTLGAFPPDMDC